jgi:hypothetical protein
MRHDGLVSSGVRSLAVRMVGYPPCRSDMSGSFPVVDKPRSRICKSSRVRQELDALKEHQRAT